MCGIAGFVGSPSEEILGAMSRSMRHRGPDDHGQISSPWATIASRRLAIIDVAGGHQPMSTAAGRVHIAYNGEVYNFRELREALRRRGATFETDADTEVVLKAYELDGPASFARLNGMFAFAILDLRGSEPQLLLVRDQFGIKPLYHATMDERLLFGSEIRTLLAAPGFVARPNTQAVVDYLSLGLHDHDAETFFSGIRSVRAAHFLTVRPGGTSETRYWEPHLSEDGDPDPATFYRLFRSAVERRLVSEVPVGSCLSGGLDSSSIVCAVDELLREHAPDAASVGDRLKTFSAVFPGDPIDERGWIDTVLGVTQAEPHFTAPESWQLIRDLGDFAWTLEQPVVSSGPYAQWAVMKLAQGRVKVLLDGQGGDELLGGYVPYRFVYLRQLLRERRFGQMLRQGLTGLELRALLRRYVRPWGQARLDPARYLRDRPSPPDRLPPARTQDHLKRRLLQDLTTYSLPSLLRYEDRISMSRSIESRVPFLDLELVEHVLSLPAEAIMRGRLSRAIFREAIRGHVPEQVRTRRKKIGFTTPEMRWLTRERQAVRGVFRSPSFLARPYWDGAAVAQAFEAICAGRLEESLFIWRVLNTELWLRVFFDRDPADVARAPGRDWQRIGDEAAARWLGASAQAALAATSRRPGHHVLITELGGTVLARIDAPRAGTALRERVRGGDVVAMRLGRSEGRVRRRVERLHRLLGSDRVGVAAVWETPDGPRVVATSGPVDPAMLAEALADDPLRAESPSVPRALIVRPVGRQPDVAVPVRPWGATTERLQAAR
jgi:asparagine synthase (glutamine-hydrolysing)